MHCSLLRLEGSLLLFVHLMHVFFCGSVEVFNCGVVLRLFSSLILLYTCECVLCLCLCMCVRVCIVLFQRDDCFFFWVEITKNKNDSIQFLFASFHLTNLVAKPKVSISIFYHFSSFFSILAYI